MMHWQRKVTTMDNHLIDSAIDFAVQAHAGQRRKGTDLPYLFHPMEAGAIAARMTDDAEIVAAAVLHDVIEDTPVRLAELEGRFGPRVARLVLAQSEDKTKSWRERKAHTIAQLKTAPREEQIVALGDKLSNIGTLYSDLVRVGDALWGRFNVSDPGNQIWYYTGLLCSLRSLEHAPEYAQFRHLVCNLIAHQLTLPGGGSVRRRKAVCTHSAWRNAAEDDKRYEMGEVCMREFSADGQRVNFYTQEGQLLGSEPIESYRDGWDDFT